ncbi:reductase AKOR2 [Crucibulum laeve]|uniref:Reductase AKOR2 n=1 Tax=Crucibulum laeve TaxID=68775 RepID=A0A5C3LWN0_9AGAR|nr:reductase AKOR2 [Crucibulum laeve]
MTTDRKISLNNGTQIPIIASGTFSLPTGGELPPLNTAEISEAIARNELKTKSWILNALKNGYRHLDTAVIYQTERVVGTAMKESGIPREEIFVTTKIPWNHYSRVAASLDESLKALGLDYVDLYLIHWPQTMAYDGDKEFLPRNEDGSWKVVDSPTFNDVWAEMEKLLKAGKVKAIGVSNFSIKTLEELAKTAKVTPAVNQVEMHPYLAQNDLREYCAKKGIAVAAYTPSGYDIVRNDPTIVEIAKKYGVTSNQVILSWHLSRDTIIIPKSEKDERQKENITLPVLSAEDLSKISALDRKERLCNSPDANGMVFGWTVEKLGWA